MSFCTLWEEKSLTNLIRDMFTDEPELLNSKEEAMFEVLQEAEAILERDVTKELLWSNENINKTLDMYKLGAPAELGAPEFIKQGKLSTRSKFTSKSIDDLFHGSTASALMFKSFANERIINSFLIGKRGEPFVTTDEQLQTNLTDLKNQLFEDLQTYLMLNGLLEQNEAIKLYNDNGDFINTSDNHYLEVMDIAYKHSNSLDHTLIFDGNTIPNLDRLNDSDLSTAYNTAVFLTNFDSIIKESYGSLININELYVNDLQNTLEGTKYTRKFIPESTLYWSNEAHSDEGVSSHNVKLPSMIIESVPAYDVNNKRTEHYLSMNELYLLAAVTNEFETQNGMRIMNTRGTVTADPIFDNYSFLSDDVAKGFQWYIDNIADVLNNKDSDSSLWKTFWPYRNIIYSLKNYFSEENLGIKQKEDESGGNISISSVLGQVLNNSFGATYTIFDKDNGLITQKVFSQNFNSTGMNNTLYAKMAANSNTKDYYDVTSIGGKTALDGVFDGIDLEEDALEAINRSDGAYSEFYSRLRQYINDKVGVSLGFKGLLATINDMKTHSPDKNTFSVNQLKQGLTRMMLALDGDFKDEAGFRNSLSAYTGVVNDSTVGSLVSRTINTPMFKAISTGFLENYPVRGMSFIKTLSGESIPAYKIANLSYKDTSLFERQRQRQENKPENKYKSLLIQNDPAILGTNTRLEIVNKKTNKAAAMFTPAESFHASFKLEFWDNIVKNNRFDVVIGAYSDKSTVITKTIDADFKIGDNTVLSMDMDELLSHVQSQGLAYYRDSVMEVLTSYKGLLDSILAKHKNKTLDLSEFTKDPLNPKKKFKKGQFITDLNSTIRALKKDIENPSHAFNNDVDLSESRKALNNFLKYSIVDLIGLVPEFTGVISEEMHYSKYADGVKLNGTLFDNYDIFSNNKLFNEFVKKQDAQFLKNYGTIETALNPGSSLLDLDGGSEVLEYYKAMGIEADDMPTVRGPLGKKADLRVEVEPGTPNLLLRKWMWTNALFRNEYLFISTKGEYMHPHKMRGYNYQGDTNITERWDTYLKESGARLENMSKRNVTNTSTIKIPVRNSKYGEPDKIRIAAIEDLTEVLHGITNTRTHKQDVHDGSSFIHPVYSRQIDSSYPGDGFSGTKKRFGTFVMDGSVVIKKDAESEISNEKMMFSRDADVKFAKLNEKMLSIPFGDLKLDYKGEFTQKYLFKQNGYNNEIVSAKLSHNGEGNILELEIIPRHGDQRRAKEVIPVPVDNLFDIYQAIGGYYSVDINGGFNEGSMDLLYEIVSETTDEEGNEGVLKDKLIHVIANHTALKAGASNLNSQNRWKDSKGLATFEVDSDLIGPQLDASYESDGSTVKEVTQIISAMAQGGLTHDIAREAYQDIQNIIKQTARTYKIPLDKAKAGDPEALSKMITDRFIDSVLQSNGNDVAKILVEKLNQDGIIIPFSNPNFYGPFVQDIITRMNTDFISRQYPGMGAVIVPSQGIIQLYDIVRDGKKITVTQKDLIKEALNNYEPDPTRSESNEEVIQRYLDQTLLPEEIFGGEAEIGDTVIVNTRGLNEWGIETVLSSEEMELDTMSKYYAFKNKHAMSKVYRVINKPRDLKPTLHSFTYQVTETEYDGEGNEVHFKRTKHANVFDFQSVKLGFYLDEAIKTGMVSDFRVAKELNNLISFIQTSQGSGKSNVVYNIRNIKDNKVLQAYVNRYLNKFKQREFALLGHNLMVPHILDFADHNLNFDNFLNDTIEDVLDRYKQGGREVGNVKFRMAELMTSDIYRSVFGRETSDSFHEIREQGVDYFKDKILKQYSKDNTTADIKLRVKGMINPLYIRFVEELPAMESSLPIHVNRRESDPDNVYKLTRYGDSGEPLYDLPNKYDYSVNVDTSGKEYINIKINNKNQKWVENSLSRIIKSFRGNIQSFDPLMRKNALSEVHRYDSNGEAIITKFNLNEITLHEFNYFSQNPYPDLLEPVRHGMHQDDILDLFADHFAVRQYASWEKSHEIIASRIPAQSMQSFMPMKIVGYTDSTKNDAFVNVHQVWLQGSDFDIDKAYLLGYSFDNEGIYHPWTNVFTYSSTDHIRELETLPMPTNTQTTESVGGVTGPDIAVEITDFINLALVGGDDITRKVHTPEAIKAFGKLLRKIGDSAYVNIENTDISQVPDLSIEEGTEEEITIAGNMLDMYVDEVIGMVNSHNRFQPKETALKNGVVSKLSRIISAPTNQLLANSPISISEVHEAVDSNRRRRREAAIERGETVGEDIVNSPYDIISYGKLQYNAAVGKDDVGIFANGVKAFYGLTDYYNNLYRDIDSTNMEDIIKRGALFDVTVAFHDGNKLKTFRSSTIADLQLSKTVRDVLTEGSNLDAVTSAQTDAALILSALLSAATDNAKELLMAKINATPDLASMHVYLATLGLEIEDIVDIMTSDVADDVVTMRESNTFINEYGYGMDSIFNILANKYAGDNIKLTNLKSFKDVYKASKELTALSGLFGVNQKRKANTWEIYNFLNRFEGVFKATNESYKKTISFNEDKSINFDTLVEKIKQNRPDLLTSGIGYDVNGMPAIIDTSEEYIREILTRVSQIPVTVKNYDGSSTNKTVNLITEDADFRYYIDESNPAYKEAVKDYYGLIKHTFNVFDVVDTVPHFKEMINSLILSHDILNELSIKYRFVTTVLKDIINKGNDNIVGFDSSYVDIGTINKGINFLDTLAREGWLKSRATDISFDVKDLMKLANVETFQIYTSNEAASGIQIDGLVTRDVHVNDTQATTIDLNSAYNIANFKRAMESLVLPTLHAITADEFSNSLKVETALTPFGTRGSAIMSTFPLQQLNNPVFAKRFQDLINRFDSLDTDVETKDIFKNANGKALKWRDLFFVYNLIVNNEKYGNKRLTPLMENYMKESDSLGQDYVKYWADIESGKVNLFEGTNEGELRDALETNLLFHITNVEGGMSYVETGKEGVSVTNPDFVLLSDAKFSESINSQNKRMYDIMALLREKGIIITLEC